MLEEILSSVKDAERQAQETIAAAEAEASAVARDNQKQIDEMWESARQQAKARRANTLAEAESHAGAQAAHIAAEYDAECAALREKGLAEIGGLVNYLTEIVFNGDC